MTTDQDRSREMNADTAGVIVPLTARETILQRDGREISILVAREDVTITHAHYAAGERVAGPHVHQKHTDAFYVLEGQLTFEIGREGERITLSSGGFVAVPPGVAHSFRNDSDRPARWLTIHVDHRKCLSALLCRGSAASLTTRRVSRISQGD